MREDPDVILVGELRDAETITMAMTAAETGHLVLGHAAHDERRQDHRPHHRRAAGGGARADQELSRRRACSPWSPRSWSKTADARGRKAICEILVMTKAIAKLIQSDQTHQIPTQMQMGRDLGMQLLDQALLAADRGARDRSGRRLCLCARQEARSRST